MPYLAIRMGSDKITNFYFNKKEKTIWFFNLHSFVEMGRMRRAGLPATMVSAATSFLSMLTI